MNALLLPIHPPKFNWLFSFLKSIPDNEIETLNFELVLLISNEKDLIQIKRAITNLMPEFSKVIKYFNVHEYIEFHLGDPVLLDRYIKNTDRCIVNLKKFAALHWAQLYYQYIAVIDCDTIFNGTTKHTFERLIQNYQQKKVFGGGINTSDLIQQIQKESAAYFSQNDYVFIKNITNNFNAYAWFFDVPFYQKSHLSDFFNYFLDQKKEDYNFWHRIHWESFEHLIYQFYLLCKQDFTFIDYGNIARKFIPEALTYADLNKIQLKYNYYPVWARFRNILNNPENTSINKPEMFYHTDRI